MPCQSLVLPRRDQVPEHQPGNSEGFLKKAGTRSLNNRNQQNKQDDPVRHIHAEPSSVLDTQLTSREPSIRLNVLVTGSACHFRR